MTSPEGGADALALLAMVGCRSFDSSGVPRRPEVAVSGPDGGGDAGTAGQLEIAR